MDGYRMRIALFSDTLWPQVNGVSLTLARLVEFLTARDCDVLVVGPRTGALDEHNGAGRLSGNGNGHNNGNGNGNGNGVRSRLVGADIHDNGDARADEGRRARPARPIRVARVPGVPLPRYPELRVAAPWSARAARMARRFQPDVVHVLTEFSIGWLGQRVARELSVPVVSSFHTDFPRYIRYYGLGLLSEPLWGYLRWFHRRTAFTYCPSEVTRRHLERRGFGDVRIWGRGVDVARFRPGRRDPAARAAHGPPSAIHLLYVGRLAREKDLDLLFEAVRRLPDDPRVHLVLTGDGPYAPEARAHAPPNSTFTGYLSGDALATAYASADIFAFPSRTETYGNAVLEALAAGLPVVAMREGGVLENVQDGVNGLLCPPGDVDTFAGALGRLAADPELRRRMGASARAWAERRTWDRAFDELLAGYREAAGRPRRSSRRELVHA